MCLILAVGILSTDYVKRQTGDGMNTGTEAVAEAAKNEAKTNPEAKERSLWDVSEPQTVQESVVPPMESVGRQIDEEAASVKDSGVLRDEDDKENPVLLRLQELDEQIARNRAREAETTANSRKASAESERKLWEGEMQHMLGILKEHLDANQQDELMLQQKDWMKDRESRAIAASEKQAGGAMEELNYSMTLAEITRSRAYELAEIYSPFLSE